ncbi:hypothetical protein MA376_005324, partial [Klebsiella pneumoniae]
MEVANVPRRHCCLFARPIPIVEVAAEADAMVTVFGILNLTEDSFFDESRRLDPAGAVTAAIEML